MDESEEKAPHEAEGFKSERTSTDESLQVERKKSDEEYESAKKPAEDQSDAVSDAVVQKASDSADLVLEEARDLAESRLEAARVLQREVVKEERARADAILRQERSVADASYAEVQKTRNRADRVLKDARELADISHAEVQKARDRADQILKDARDLADIAHTEVQGARDRADQVLKDARHLADTRLEEVRVKQSEIVKGERARASETLRGEQDTAGHNLIEERGRRHLLLAQLLGMERSETDQNLLVERARADRAVVTRDEFLGMVSHDLRSMLTTITLSAGMLAETAAEDEAGKCVSKAATMIQDSAIRIDRLVGDLMDIASIELGKLSVVPKPQDAVAVLTDVMDAFKATALEKGISLEAEPVEGEVIALFDRDRILQVLGNLVSNAIKFSNPGGKIVIRLERSAGFICFSVRDNGEGIRGDQLESVFERFWQGAQSDRRGLGLGLFISKRLIEAHGGRIWATSKIGAGSTFFFTLPAVLKDSPLLH